MQTTAPLDAALARLSQALTTLETAVARRLERERARDGLEEALARFAEDRATLAGTLDDEKARAARLEDANREVSRRLVAAMESIRSVLESHGG
jgi:chromosome segregation ATPase